MPKIKQPKLTKLLVSTVTMKLAVEGCPTLELELAWTMRAVIFLESRLRVEGTPINVLQNQGGFWTDLDCTKLALGIWACSLQEHPEYADEEGFEVIASYITPENYLTAAQALKDAFLESLTKEKREEFKKAQESVDAVADGKPANLTPNPTPAPVVGP